MSGPEKLSRERAKEQTRQIIIEHSKEEFLKNGYLNVSVRSLAKSANLTSGAIYTHFKDKAELFECLVRPALSELKALLSEVHKERMGHLSGKGDLPGLGIGLGKLKTMVGKIYDHFTEFRLLMVSSAGSGQENFLKGISEYYSECSAQYLAALRKSGIHVLPVEPETLRILSYAYFTAIFEIVGQNLPKERAEVCIVPLFKFFQPGWDKLVTS
ncbi:MAG: TetR/AcrR family transcriptional regulator [Deltaproteobacteria bacterium]|jgi:AcrR family transcriptional regulator|nr:TetR/AcrR family transcriptional regulator [Deltaproteobacteria bacterium]